MEDQRYDLERAQAEAEILQRKIKSGDALSYGEAESKLELTPVEELLQRKIIDLDPIQESRNATVRERADLAGLVERPLLSACEELYDKNIITLATSANKQDVEYPDWEHPGLNKPAEGAYIIIYFDALSAKNQAIGRTLGEVSFGDGVNQLKIIFPLTKESTFEDVQVQALEKAHKFVKQAYRVMTFTIEEMRQNYGYKPDDESVQIGDFGNFYYWAPEFNAFFLSREQYEKAIEQVDEE